MRAILCLGAVMFLASCDNSKEQLTTTQATLTGVTKERDDLKSKVASLQEELNVTKEDLAKAKALPAPSGGTMAAKTPDTKTPSADTNGKTAKPKHAHKS